MTQTAYSAKWKASKSRSKQRKFTANAPAHIRNHFMGAPLSKELRQKHTTRTMPARTGDKVKVVRGQFKGHIGKIEKSDASKTKVFVTGAEIQKRDGSKALYPIHPSNLIILELDMGDKKRMISLERKKSKGIKPVEKKEKKPAQKEVKQEEKKVESK